MPDVTASPAHPAADDDDHRPEDHAADAEARPGPGGPHLDVVVVGGGPAGLSAALLLGRSRRSVVVVDEGRPRNATAGHVHGFLTRDGVPPAELRRLALEEVRRYGVEVREGRVVALHPRPDAPVADAPRGARPRVDVELADGTHLAARRVVVATGLRDELPDVPGLAARWGRDVLHCPYCHGWEVRDAAVAVLVDRPEDAAKALTMTQWSAHVTVVLHGVAADALDPAAAERLAVLGVPVEPGPVTGLVVEDDALVAVRTPARDVPVRALVVQPRLVGAGVPVPAPGAEDPPDVGVAAHAEVLGCVAADTDGRTSVPHVWAAGNVADPGGQVITAAAAGHRAGLVVDHDLIEEDVEAAVARARRTA